MLPLDALEDALYAAARAVVGDAQLSTSALVDAIRDRSARYTSDRAKLAKPASPKADLAARAVFFTITDAPKIAIPIAELVSRRVLPSARPLRVVDLGAGCGAMSLGLIAALADADGAKTALAHDPSDPNTAGTSNAPLALSITAIDRDRDALAIATKTIRTLASSTATTSPTATASTGTTSPTATATTATTNSSATTSPTATAATASPTATATNAATNPTATTTATTATTTATTATTSPTATASTATTNPTATATNATTNPPTASGTTATATASTATSTVEVSLTTRVDDATTATIPACDLVLIGTMLNELATDAARLAVVERALAAIGEDGAVIILEPALRDTTRGLHVLRDAILARGSAHVFAPCTRQSAPCPALADPTDWCHEHHALGRAPALPPRTHELARLTHLRDDGLKWSYLVLRKQAHTLSADPGAWRIVGTPWQQKGKLEVLACGNAGRVTLRLLKRHRAASNRALEGVAKGYVVRVEPARDAHATEPDANDTRIEITDETRVEIVFPRETES